MWSSTAGSKEEISSLVKFPNLQRKYSRRISLWVGALILFFIANSPMDWLLPLLDSMNHLIPYYYTILRPRIALFKALLFGVIVIFGMHVLGRDILKHGNLRMMSTKILVLTTVIFVSFFLLYLRFGLFSQGMVYAKESYHVFSLRKGWYYRRVLVPGIVYFLSLSFLISSRSFSIVTYFVFTLALTFILIFLTTNYLCKSNTNHNSGTSLNLEKALVCVSVCTSSFIAYQYQIPGYGDQAIFIFVLVMAIFPLTRESRLILLVFSLATHENAVFIFVPLIIFWFPRNERLEAFGIIISYLFFVSLPYNLNLIGALAPHLNVGNTSAFQYFLSNLSLVVLGVFFAYKLLWFLVGYFMIELERRNYRFGILAIVGTIISPLFLLVIALDTSRIAGFGFLGVLLSTKVFLNNYEGLSARRKQIFLVFFILNFIIPSPYIGLNVGRGALFFDGLYSWILEAAKAAFLFFSKYMGG